MRCLKIWLRALQSNRPEGVAKVFCIFALAFLGPYIAQGARKGSTQKGAGQGPMYSQAVNGHGSTVPVACRRKRNSKRLQPQLARFQGLI